MEEVHHHQLSINLIQTNALSVSLCVDDRRDHLEAFCQQAAAFLHIEVRRGFSLLTIRHPRPGLVDELTAGHRVLLQINAADVVQCVLED